jgi:hypothetical protein
MLLALVAAPVAPACSRPDTPPAQASPSATGATRDEVARALRAELAPTIRQELREELRPIVAAELRAEMAKTSARTDRSPNPNPDTPDAQQGEPMAADARPLSESSDIWTTPGTTIWPYAGGLRLAELQVGTGLEDKLPVGIELHYTTIPEVLYCYTVFDNPAQDLTVTHVWRRSGRLVSKVELEVGKSPKWRTWSKQRTQPHWSGVWSCEVLAPDGTQLGLTVFQVGG